MEEFLRLNSVDDRARDLLLAQGEDTQKSVLSLGHFREGRNPSAGLVDRVNRVKDGSLPPRRGKTFFGCRHCGVGNDIETLKCEGCGRTLN